MIYAIYKIVCEDASVNFIYVGSTQSFRHRKALHKSCCNNEKQNEYNNKLYKTIRENGGWNNFRMVCIAEVEVESKRQAEITEEDYRLKLQANLNSKRCYVSEEQLKEYKKEYYEDNKEQIKERQKDYKETNKEKLKEYKKDYTETNKEKLKKYHEDYRETNKAKINKKCECECGGKYTIVNKSRHLNTNKHKKYLS